MAKTSTDARKHLREWSRFFATGRWFAESIIKEFINNHKKKKYLKQSLQRLIERGFITEQNSKLVATETGRRFFSRHNKISVDHGRRRWDGKWRLITFDVPIDYNLKRDHLRKLIKEFDFYPLQKSVWVCPYHLTEGLWQELVKNELDRYCRVMTVEFIEGDEDLRKHFKLPA